MIGLREYTCVVDYLVWNILQLLVEFFNTYNCQIIINTDIYLATISIGKA